MCYAKPNWSEPDADELHQEPLLRELFKKKGHLVKGQRHEIEILETRQKFKP